MLLRIRDFWEKFAYLSVSVVGLSVLVSSCLSSRNFEAGKVKDIDVSQVSAKGVARIDWACSGIGNQHPAGKNSQEEYCEWTREPTAFSGKAQSLKGSGNIEDVQIQKACVFTTSFDHSREHFLTKRVWKKSDRFDDESSPFWATQFNSYAFLVGGTEPAPPRSQRKGIIGHCLEMNSCTPPNCVPTRASDPQICQALNQLGRRGCKIDTEYRVAPSLTANESMLRSGGVLGLDDQVVKPQLEVRDSLAPHCYYAVDPAFSSGSSANIGQFVPSEQRTLLVCDVGPSALNKGNCDQLAEDVSTVVTLKVVNNSCELTRNAVDPIGLAAGKICAIKSRDGAVVRESDSETAAERETLPLSTEVGVRGFKGGGRWVSVSYFADGDVIRGAGNQTPSFVERAEFFSMKGELECREPSDSEKAFF